LLVAAGCGVLLGLSDPIDAPAATDGPNEVAMEIDAHGVADDSSADQEGPAQEGGRIGSEGGVEGAPLDAALDVGIGADATTPSDAPVSSDAAGVDGLAPCTDALVYVPTCEASSDCQGACMCCCDYGSGTIACDLRSNCKADNMYACLP
jgi:hypothetical protein